MGSTTHVLSSSSKRTPPTCGWQRVVQLVNHGPRSLHCITPGEPDMPAVEVEGSSSGCEEEARSSALPTTPFGSPDVAPTIAGSLGPTSRDKPKPKVGTVYTSTVALPCRQSQTSMYTLSHGVSCLCLEGSARGQRCPPPCSVLARVAMSMSRAGRARQLRFMASHARTHAQLHGSRRVLQKSPRKRCV
jgi:hypothetical protein